MHVYTQLLQYSIYTGRSDVPVGAIIAVIVILSFAAVAVMCGVLFLYR